MFTAVQTAVSQAKCPGWASKPNLNSSTPLFHTSFNYPAHAQGDKVISLYVVGIIVVVIGTKITGSLDLGICVCCKYH